MAPRVYDDDDEESYDEDEGSTVACPYCGQQMYEDSPRCPHCERYVSEEDAPPARKPWWIVVGTLVCLYAVYRWIVG